MVDEPTAFINRSKVEAMFKKEKEKAFMASVCLDLKHLRSTEIVGKPYLAGYTMLKFQRLMAEKETQGSM